MEVNAIQLLFINNNPMNDTQKQELRELLADCWITAQDAMENNGGHKTMSQPFQRFADSVILPKEEVKQEPTGYEWHGVFLSNTEYASINDEEKVKARPLYAHPVKQEKQECEKFCSLNHCDTNGCSNRERSMVEPKKFLHYHDRMNDLYPVCQKIKGIKLTNNQGVFFEENNGMCELHTINTLDNTK